MSEQRLSREPLIWASTGGTFEFRIQVELRGRPKSGDVGFFEEAMKLATDVLRRAARGQRFTGFDDCPAPDPAAGSVEGGTK